MARTPWPGNQHRRRWARIALALSALLHLLFLCLVELIYKPAAPPLRTYRIRLESPPDYYADESLPSLAPSRLPVPTFSPDGTVGPGERPSFGLGGILEGEGPGEGVAGIEGLPSGRTGGGGGVGEKAEAFAVPELPEPDLDALLLEKLRQEVAEREQYARFQLLDADTTDDKSQRRSRARQIVERAIAAMGGREALGGIQEMKARVWVEALEHVIVTYSGIRIVHVEVIPTPPYPYPVAIWQFGKAGFSDTPIRSPPLTADNPYLTRNPSQSKRRYDTLFGPRWAFFPARTRQLREQGESVRWQFIEHFLGEDVDVIYIGEEKFGKVPVEVIQVEDTRYGNHAEAFFDQETGLLLATRDGLIPAEQEWYRENYPQFPPVWTTLYLGYQPVQEALVPHRLQRSGPECPDCRGSGRRRTVEVTVHLTIGVNGQEPDPATPSLEPTE